MSTGPIASRCGVGCDHRAALMHLGLKTLRAFLLEHADASQLVLAVVVATEGSTYRKPGAMMLIGPDGDYAGLVSGGCLEGDLTERAREVLSSGEPLRVHYDLKDDDLLFGLGLGCGGAVDLLLLRLDAARQFAPLGSLFEALDAGEHCQLALVCDSTDKSLPVGSTALFSSGAIRTGPAPILDRLRRGAPGPARARREVLESPQGSAGLLVIGIAPSPHVLVCGAGPDAVPLVSQVLALGWDCTVADHRENFADPTRFPPGAQMLCQRPKALSGHAILERIDAAVIMTHHVGHDADYLRAFREKPPAYLGLLGPKARRDRLIEETGSQALAIHGPAGLDIGAELPEAIALAIMAEMHAVLAGRQGGPLIDV